MFYPRHSGRCTIRGSIYYRALSHACSLWRIINSTTRRPIFTKDPMSEAAKFHSANKRWRWRFGSFATKRFVESSSTQNKSCTTHQELSIDVKKSLKSMKSTEVMKEIKHRSCPAREPAFLFSRKRPPNGNRWIDNRVEIDTCVCVCLTGVCQCVCVQSASLPAGPVAGPTIFIKNLMQ